MGHRAYLEVLEKRKTLFPLPGFELSIKVVILLIRSGYFVSEYMSHVSFVFRFPSNTTSSEQMMPQYNNPGPSSSHYSFPYFQDLPLYSEQPTYTPFAMKTYSSFTERENAYNFQPENHTSDKESHYKQLKQSPSTSLPKSGHRVRFSFEMTEKTKEASDFSRSISTGTGYLKPPKVRKKFRPIYILMELCSLCFCNPISCVKVINGCQIDFYDIYADSCLKFPILVNVVQINGEFSYIPRCNSNRA